MSWVRGEGVVRWDTAFGAQANGVRVRDKRDGECDSADMEQRGQERVGGGHFMSPRSCL